MSETGAARVDFYVLEAAGEEARRRFACRLAEKAYRLQHSVRLEVPGVEAARALDELLWTFRDGSFVPHELRTEPSPEPLSPVTIGYEGTYEGAADLLINLTDRVPENLHSFPRIAEIVTSDDEGRSRSRRLFVDYRSRGHTLETHKL